VSIQYYRPEKAKGSLTQCSFEEAKQLHATLGGFIKKIEELIAQEAAADPSVAEMSLPLDPSGIRVAKREGPPGRE